MANSSPALSSLMLPPRTVSGSNGASPRSRGAKNGPRLVVFSGGTAFNLVASRLRQLTDQVAYILPVSDDGGSTAEIVRVLGGPAVGDIRSRCLRLADDSDDEAKAVKALLAHRLHGTDSMAAKLEWYTIVEGDADLWAGVSEPYKHVIRAFLVHFHSAIMRHSSESFDFCNGSIGNFFFAGSRTFFRSLEGAIFLFSRVARLPEGSIVLPAICTEERITLGAELEDGSVLRGQNMISHPPPPTLSTSSRNNHASSPSPTAAASSSTTVDKMTVDLLSSPIRRIFYLSNEGSGQEHEVFPDANPRAIHEIERADAIIYGMGSLYTSICPILCLDGVGEAISRREGIPKILCLNASHDRETASSLRGPPMTACDVVQAVTDALNRRRDKQAGHRLKYRPSTYVDALLVPRGGTINVDIGALDQLCINHVTEVDSVLDENGAHLFDPSALVDAIERTIFIVRQVVVDEEREMGGRPVLANGPPVLMTYDPSAVSSRVNDVVAGDRERDREGLTRFEVRGGGMGRRGGGQLPPEQDYSYSI